MSNSELFIDEVMRVPDEPIHPHVFDMLMHEGWRLLSPAFVRHNHIRLQNQLVGTVPLRVRLEGFAFSKSQRQLIRRNAHYRLKLGPIRIDPIKEALFLKHMTRFKDNLPQSIYDFLNEQSYQLPVAGGEFNLYDGDKLIACSFIHVGNVSVNATYCFFDPDYQRQSLGHYTMLVELMYAMQIGRKYYYPGYAYTVPSHMDYKKNFQQLEGMNWKTVDWLPMERVVPMKCEVGSVKLEA